MKKVKNMTRRGLSMFLAFVLCLSLVNLTAFAAEDIQPADVTVDGDGRTPADPTGGAFYILKPSSEGQYVELGVTDQIGGNGWYNLGWGGISITEGLQSTAQKGTNYDAQNSGNGTVVTEPDPSAFPTLTYNGHEYKYEKLQDAGDYTYSVVWARFAYSWNWTDKDGITYNGPDQKAESGNTDIGNRYWHIDGYAVLKDAPTKYTGSILIEKKIEGVTDASAYANTMFVFQVTDKDGNVVRTETITGTGTALVGSLVDGATYTVTEISAGEVDGYILSNEMANQTASVQAAKDATKVTITNQYTKDWSQVETTSVNVTKVWDDDGFESARPESVTVRLLANGESTDNTIELNAGNGWKSQFNNLPVASETYPGGITYTVEEVSETGYTSSVEGNAGIGFTITNTSQYGKLTVTKIVKGDDIDADKEFSFTVTATGYEKTFTLKAGESTTLTVLPGKYTVTEDMEAAAIEGYDLKTIVTGTVTGSFTVTTGRTVTATVTNTYTKSEPDPKDPFPGFPVEIKYTLTYDPNGGVLFFPGTTVTKSATSAALSYEFTVDNGLVPTRAGYVFNGWSLTKGGTKVDTVTAEYPNCDVTVYAIWGIAIPETFPDNSVDEDVPEPEVPEMGLNRFKLIYDGNAEGVTSVPAPDTATGLFSYTFTVSSQVPTLAGYTFLGWAYDKAGTNMVGSTVTVSAPVGSTPAVDGSEQESDIPQFGGFAPIALAAEDESAAVGATYSVTIYAIWQRIPPYNPDNNDPDPQPTEPDPQPTEPTDPDIEIPEDDVPLAPAPVEPEEPDIEIPEDDVPLAPAPVEPEEPDIEIPEDDVPLASAPQTGDNSGMWLFTAALSAMGLVVLTLTGKRKEEEKA